MILLNALPLILAFSIIYFPVTILIQKKRSRFNFRRYSIQTVFIYYIVTVISLTFFPMPMVTRWSASLHGFSEFNQRDNLIPFHSIFDILFHSVDIEVILKQIGGNILLMLPFGFLLPIVSKKYGKSLKMLMTIASFSLGIELGQALLGFIIGIIYRSTDIDDIVLNVAGGMLGLTLIKLAGRLLPVNKAKMSEKDLLMHSQDVGE
ncbi:MAG: VanZ family protein [Sporolactobacillus sp.]